MNTANVRAILRIVGVLTVFVTMIGASLTMLGTWSMNRVMQSAVVGMDLHLTVPDVGAYATLSWVVVALWGLILYALSPAIARHITSEPARVAVDTELPARSEIARG